MHDPAKAAQRAESRRRGGLARHGRTIGTVSVDEKPVKLRSLADVLALLERTVNDVLKLENSLSRASTIARICGAFVSAFQIGELEQRMKALESRLNDEH